MIRGILSIILSVLLFLMGVFQPRLSCAQEKNEYTIAVLDLNANGISQTEAKSLSNSLHVQLTRTVPSEEFIKKSGISYTVVERSQMDKIFEQFDIQNTGCTDISCAVEFGKMLSVERIIIGSVGLVGDTYTINTRIVDVESTRTLKVADFSVKGKRDKLLNKGVPKVANDLLGIKSHKKLYIITGVLIGVIGVAAAVLWPADEDDTATISINLPVPSE